MVVKFCYLSILSFSEIWGKTKTTILKKQNFGANPKLDHLFTKSRFYYMRRCRVQHDIEWIFINLQSRRVLNGWVLLRDGNKCKVLQIFLPAETNNLCSHFLTFPQIFCTLSSPQPPPTKVFGCNIFACKISPLFYATQSFLLKFNSPSLTISQLLRLVQGLFLYRTYLSAIFCFCLSSPCV